MTLACQPRCLQLRPLACRRFFHAGLISCLAIFALPLQAQVLQLGPGLMDGPARWIWVVNGDGSVGSCNRRVQGTEESGESFACSKAVEPAPGRRALAVYPAARKDLTQRAWFVLDDGGLVVCLLPTTGPPAAPSCGRAHHTDDFAVVNLIPIETAGARQWSWALSRAGQPGLCSFQSGSHDPPETVSCASATGLELEVANVVPARTQGSTRLAWIRGKKGELGICRAELESSDSELHCELLAAAG